MSSCTEDGISTPLKWTRLSQNHSITAWLTLERTSGSHLVQPHCTSREGHLETVAQNRVQVAFDYLQERRLYNLSGQPVPMLGHPPSKVCFLMFRQNLLFQFVFSISFPFSRGFSISAPGPVTGHHWKESCSIPFAPSLLVFISIKSFQAFSSLC